jgi:hypothetical protein
MEDIRTDGQFCFEVVIVVVVVVVVVGVGNQSYIVGVGGTLSDGVIV